MNPARGVLQLDDARVNESQAVTKLFEKSNFISIHFNVRTKSEPQKNRHWKQEPEEDPLPELGALDAEVVAATPELRHPVDDMEEPGHPETADRKTKPRQVAVVVKREEIVP